MHVRLLFHFVNWTLIGINSLQQLCSGRGWGRDGNRIPVEHAHGVIKATAHQLCQWESGFGLRSGLGLRRRQQWRCLCIHVKVYICIGTCVHIHSACKSESTKLVVYFLTIGLAFKQEAEYPFTAFTMDDTGTCTKSSLSLKWNSKKEFIQLEYKGAWSVFINGINAWGWDI